MSLIDEIAPRYYGEDRLRLTLTDLREPGDIALALPAQALVAFRPILITVDYSAALPQGVVLPLEFTVTAPSTVNSTRKVYRRFAPTELAFTPREGGSHLIRLAELWHNKWFGSMVLDIEGDRLRGA